MDLYWIFGISCLIVAVTAQGPVANNKVICDRPNRRNKSDSIQCEPGHGLWFHHVTGYEVRGSAPQGRCPDLNNGFRSRKDLLVPYQSACMGKQNCQIKTAWKKGACMQCILVVEFGYTCIKKEKFWEFCPDFDSIHENVRKELELPAVFVSHNYPTNLLDAEDDYGAPAHHHRECHWSFIDESKNNLNVLVLDIDVPDTITLCVDDDFKLFFTDNERYCPRGYGWRQVRRGDTFCLRPYVDKEDDGGLITINYKITHSNHYLPRNYSGLAIWLFATTEGECGNPPATESPDQTPPPEPGTTTTPTIIIIDPDKPLDKDGNPQDDELSEELLIVVIVIALLILIALLIIICLLIRRRRKRRNAETTTAAVGSNMYTEPPPPYEAGAAAIDNAGYFKVIPDTKKEKEILGAEAIVADDIPHKGKPIDDYNNDEYEDVSIVHEVKGKKKPMPLPKPKAVPATSNGTYENFGFEKEDPINPKEEGQNYTNATYENFAAYQ